MSESTFTYEVRDESQTRACAAALVSCLQPGDVVLLSGDLGAGKTCFTKGAAAALGVQAEVTSPTFNILISYEGSSLRLHHFDLYRLEDESQLDDVGYWETIEGDGVSFVEWGDLFPDSIPDDCLEVSLRSVDGQKRTLHVTSRGSRGAELACAWKNGLDALDRGNE